ncbi:MAG TPA: hypothetical protein VF591_04710 [Pyrinomonadaceae bacterium]
MKGGARGAARPFGIVGYLVCAAGFLLCVIAFYPGYMSPDSIRQLTEGRAWSFTDWHPPLMAAVWGVLDRAVPGPFGMLLLHNAVFWGALAVFWRATYRRSVWLGLCLVGLGFLPTALALLSTAWKDVGLGASLLMASALLHTARRTDSRAALLCSIPLLFYGYGVRQNAAPAVLPLALWSGFIALRVFGAPRGKAAGRAHAAMPFVVGLVYFLLLTAAVLTTTRILTGGRSSYISQAVLLYDLAAVSKERGEALFPDYLKGDENFSLESATRYYTPRSIVPLFRGEGTGVRRTENPDEVAALRAKWLEVVPANMSAYLRHHWETFKWVTGWGKDEVCHPYLATSHRFGGYDVNNWPVHRLLRAVFWKLRNTFFFRGVCWLFASLALLCLALVGRLKGELETVFVLSLSGFLYGAGYFFYALDCDFRFFWWTALASLVGLCLAASFAFERWRNRGAAASGG